MWRQPNSFLEFSMVVKKDSPYFNLFKQAMLQIKENGMLAHISMRHAHNNVKQKECYATDIFQGFVFMIFPKM